MKKMDIMAIEKLVEKHSELLQSCEGKDLYNLYKDLSGEHHLRDVFAGSPELIRDYIRSNLGMTLNNFKVFRREATLDKIINTCHSIEFANKK